ncbi:MAG: DUF3365 domain-containing protein [Methylotenera sp.]|nr:DUF3365 domain-containing protein [Methylotenera sp.]
MKKNLIISALLIQCSALTYAAENDLTLQQQYLEESQKTAQEFMQILGKTLKTQIESSGIESAISVCKQVAPAMAEQYSNQSRTVKRVSLKPRNQSQGTPDEWERKTLEYFNQAQKDGQLPAKMEVSSLEKTDSGQVFRYMKAIPTQAMCLKCHGSEQDISANLKQLLKSEYPNDLATGYSLGEVRGAISIQHLLK